jgi:hypothetical protein
MAGNTMTLDFAGDADKLKKASQEAKAALKDVDDAAADTGTAMRDQSQSATRLEDRLGSLGAATTGATDAIDSLGGGLQALADVSDYSRDRAQRLARANVDVMQATEDMAQATRDAKQASIDSEQAAIDLTQARLDEKTALQEYNDAVKEHGKGSDEARQAQIDLKQAGLDVKQATEDSAQATRDAAQANIDAKTAQVDLNDAMHEANPPQLQEWSEKLGLITPLLTAVVGVTSLVTAAQWAWNAATLASPVTWIVLGIIALVAIIALLVWKWDWVKEKGAQAWRAMKDAGQKAWDWMKKVPGWIGDAFSKIGGAISRPFIGAFNSVSDAWNSTVGSLSWTVPGWVPGIGGNTIDVPNLPRYHTGGTVPGPPGTEVPIMAMAGETVSLPGRDTGGPVRVTVMLDSAVLVDGIARQVTRRGGRGPNNVQLVLGSA